MKRIITVGDAEFIVEGEYNPRRTFNYRVYDIHGNRAFEAGYISVKEEKRPLCVSIAFRRLRDTRRWLEDGCPVRQGLKLIWAATSKHADLMAAEEAA